MLQLNQWLNDNVINKALALLLYRIKDSSQKYWIFNTFTMEYIILFKNKGDIFGTRIYKKLPKGNIFEYDRFYCLCNIGNLHWALIIVNFQSKCIKYIEGKKLKGTEYISSIMNRLDYEHMKLNKKYMTWDA